MSSEDSSNTASPSSPLGSRAIRNRKKRRRTSRETTSSPRDIDGSLFTSQSASDVTCSLCGEYYRDPKLLDCLHYFCRECIQALVSPGTSNSELSCPVCKRTTDIPDGDVDDLKTLFFVVRKTELHQDAIQAQKREQYCDQCDAEGQPEPAEFYCPQCREFICAFCEQAHKRQRKYRGHVLVTTEEVKQKPGDHLSAADHPEEKYCKKHKKVQLRYYCCQCEVVMCNDCVVLEHQGHQCDTIENCSPGCKKTLQGQLGPLVADQTKILNAIREVRKTKSTVENQVANAEKEVREVFARIVAIVQRHEEMLLGAIREQAKEKADILDDQLQTLTLGASDITRLVSFVRECVENGDGTEVMSLRLLMTEHIQQQIKRSERLSLTPTAEADIAVSVATCPNTVTSLLQQAAVVSLPKPDPAKCTLEGPGLQLAQTNQTAGFTLHAKYRNGKPCRDAQNVRAELKSKVDGSVIEAVVEIQTPAVYQVRYCPKTRGRHELTVCVHETPVEGSPFPVYVEHPPKLLHDAQEPVQRITGLNRPYGAVFTESGHLMVSDSDAKKELNTQNTGGLQNCLIAGGIAEVDIKKCQVVGRHGRESLRNPTGICIDKKGFRYVVDNTNDVEKSIKKYDKSWKLVASTNVHGLLNRPGRITLSPEGEIFICDRGNNSIKVFDTGLNYRRELSASFKRPVDIAFDDKGVVYVAELNGNRIVKLDSAGRRRALEIGTKEPGKLKSPRGIVIHRELIYVTERDNRKISVFDANGRFVTDFGSQAGLHNPASIVVDEDGFFYVCDEENACVLVF